ncbi:hypothetical protein ACFX2I_000190 [Malus domestica]
MIGDIDPFSVDLFYPDSITFEHQTPQVSGRRQLQGLRSTSQGGPSSRTSCSPTTPSSSKKSRVRERILLAYIILLYILKTVSSSSKKNKERRRRRWCIPETFH